MVYGPGGASLRPTPRLSKVMQVNLPLSSGFTVAQLEELAPRPAINSSGGPSPSMS
jgi:hypothetical protein